MGKKHFCFFQTAETGNRTPNSGVKGSGANHYPRTKAWDISLNCHIGKYGGIIRLKIVFLESVTFQLHARMLSSVALKSLQSYDIFRTLRSGSLSLTAMLDFSGKADTSIHGLRVDDSATSQPNTDQ